MTRVTRRDLLQKGGQGAVALGAMAALDSCGGKSSKPGTTSVGTPAVGTTAEGKPVRGGRLAVSIMSGGPAETLDPSRGATPPDLVRDAQLYNTLFSLDEKLRVVPALALAAESNKDATSWMLRLRDGVTWHDGKPFTADDVVYTFKAWSTPENFGYAALAGLVDFKHVRKRGKLSVEVPLLTAVADFASLFASYYNMVVQDGSTAASFKRRPIGTGPFMYESFTPGQRSVFVRNPNYWEPGGKPYLDRVEIVSSFSDEGARLNSLLSGQTNALLAMPAVEWKQQQSAGRIDVRRSSSPWAFQFCVRVDKAPFDDVRVRQAMKYMVDRQGIIDGALAGLGEVGNDLFGGSKAFKPKHYLDLPPRSHDPEKAKALLKAAGHENLTFTLPIAPALGGYVEAGTLFKEQAKAAGVTVKLNNVSPGQYFAYPQYPNRTIQVSSGTIYPSLTPLYRAFFTSGSPVDETHWGSPAHDKLINQAVGATDDARAAELWRQIQQAQYDEGGEIIVAQADVLDATAKNVRGLKESPYWNFNNFRFVDGWIAA